MELATGRLSEIAKINSKILANSKILNEKNSNIISAQKYIKLISSEIDQLKESNNTVDTGSDKLQELIESLDTYVEKYEEYINEKSYYDFIAIMLKDGGIKTRIIKQYLPILNKYINQYLTQLDFFVNFNINENFEEVIKSRHCIFTSFIDKYLSLFNLIRVEFSNFFIASFRLSSRSPRLLPSKRIISVIEGAKLKIHNKDLCCKEQMLFF